METIINATGVISGSIWAGRHYRAIEACEISYIS
jgi:hypothetical protein